MNALKILDSKVKEALSNMVIEVSNDDIVPLAVTKDSNKYVISAKLSLSNTDGNQLLKKSDGLYFSIDSEYADGILTLKVNGNIIGQHVIALPSIVNSASYDATNESLVVSFKLLDGGSQVVSVPVGALIREWEPDNSDANKVVELHRDVNVQGTDKLSADVRIAEDTDNILEKQGNTLIVKGTSDKIKHNGQNLSSVIETLQSTAKDNSDNIAAEKERAQNAESGLTQKITELTNTVTSNTDKIAAEKERAEKAETANADAIKSLETTASNLKDSITAETTRA